MNEIQLARERESKCKGGAVRGREGGSKGEDYIFHKVFFLSPNVKYVRQAHTLPSFGLAY